jgi:hypothetical protein
MTEGKMLVDGFIGRLEVKWRNFQGFAWKLEGVSWGSKKFEEFSKV